MSDLSGLVRKGLKLNVKSVATAPPPTPLGSPVATSAVPTSGKRRRLELINAARSGNACYQKGSLFVASSAAVEEKKKFAAKKRRRTKRALDSFTLTTAFYRAAALEASSNQIEPAAAAGMSK